MLEPSRLDDDSKVQTELDDFYRPSADIATQWSMQSFDLNLQTRLWGPWSLSLTVMGLLSVKALPVTCKNVH